MQRFLGACALIVGLFSIASADVLKQYDTSTTGTIQPASVCVGNQPCVVDVNSVSTSSGSLVVQSTTATGAHDVFRVENFADSSNLRVTQQGITYASSVVVGQTAALHANSVLTSSGSIVVQSTSATAAHNVLNVRNDAGTTVASVQQDGKMGIGNTSPVTGNPLMQVYSTGLAELALAGGSSNNFPRLWLDDQEAGAVDCFLENGRVADGITGIYCDSPSASTVLAVDGSARAVMLGQAPDNATSGSIIMYSTSTTAINPVLKIMAANTTTELMRIQQNGLVGVANVSPCSTCTVHIVGNIAVTGNLACSSRTKAQLEAETPTDVGQCHYCTDCSNSIHMVVSTGSAVSQYDSFTGGTAWH